MLNLIYFCSDIFLSLNEITEEQDSNYFISVVNIPIGVENGIPEYILRHLVMIDGKLVNIVLQSFPIKILLIF
jgi:hypothetical protein